MSDIFKFQYFAASENGFFVKQNVLEPCLCDNIRF